MHCTSLYSTTNLMELWQKSTSIPNVVQFIPTSPFFKDSKEKIEELTISQNFLSDLRLLNQNQPIKKDRRYTWTKEANRYFEKLTQQIPIKERNQLAYWSEVVKDLKEEFPKIESIFTEERCLHHYFDKFASKDSHPLSKEEIKFINKEVNDLMSQPKEIVKKLRFEFNTARSTSVIKNHIKKLLAKQNRLKENKLSIFSKKPKLNLIPIIKKTKKQRIEEVDILTFSPTLIQQLEETINWDPLSVLV